MVRWLFTVAMSIGLVASSSGQDRSPPRTGAPAPSFELVTAAEKDGAITVRYSHMGLGVVTLMMDGKPVRTTGYVQYEITFNAVGKGVAVLGADGKAIDSKDLLKRLAKPTAVAVFVFPPEVESKPDPFYLGVLREDIVVFAVPSKEFTSVQQGKK